LGLLGQKPLDSDSTISKIDDLKLVKQICKLQHFSDNTNIDDEANRLIKSGLFQSILLIASNQI
jgi:hypothetical protein